MINQRLAIKQILQNKSIVEYLELQGHYPAQRMSGGRLSYLCPLPWHTESKPSFVVWTEAEYENFYCFGCSGKHNILHLISFMENISIRQVIEKLSDGMEFSVEDSINLVIKEAGANWHSLNLQNEISNTLIDISTICSAFLESVQYNEAECDRIDKLWTVVDRALQDYDFETIETVYEEIGPLVSRRTELFHKNEINELHKKYSK